MSPSERIPSSVKALALLALTLSSTLARADEGGQPSLFRPALLEVSLNGVDSPEPLLLLTNDGGEFYASASAFEAWRLRPPSAGAISFDGETYYPLAAIDGLELELDQAGQILRLHAAPQGFALQRSSLTDQSEMPMTPAATGFYLGYDGFAEHVGGNFNAAGALDLGLFTAHGTGSLTLVGAAGDGPDRLTRLETNWTIDGPASLTTVQIGDAVSAVSQGGVPIRFGGIRYGRNFALRPGFLTMPLPAASGDATLPSVVDIYVNNSLQASQSVAPGPFELSNIPVQSGGGNVQIVIRDMLGRQLVIDQPYYASTQLLRRGLHDFSYEAGFIRRDFGRRSFDYGALMLSTTHRYGVSDQVTVEGHAEATDGRQMAGLSLAVLHPPMGLGGLSASVSHSEQGTGYRLAGSAERSSASVSFGLRGEYSDSHYAFVGMSSSQQSLRLTVQAFADTSFSRGSIGANLLYRDRRDGPDESLAGGVATLRISGDAALQLFARRALSGPSQNQVGLHLALALGGRRSLSANVQHEAGRLGGTLSFQQDAPAGIGSGYRATASVGEIDSVEAAYVRNFAATSVTAQIGHARGRSGIRLSAAGAIGLIGHQAFASRSLGNSFASVQLDERPGVRVYADNQLIGVTGRDGQLIVPGLRPFETNVIRVEEADLPIEFQLDQSEISIRPFARSGTRIRFSARRERGALLRVRLGDGSLLPAGSVVHKLGGDGEYVAVTGGEIYVPDMSGTASFKAIWDHESCEFTASVAENDDPQPFLDNIICTSGERYAGR